MKKDAATTKARKALDKEQKEVREKELALERVRKREEAKIEKDRRAAERQEKATLQKAEKEAQKAKAIANKASILASKALKSSTKPNKGKRKLGESNIEVVNIPVAKRVASRTTKGRAVIMPVRFIQKL